MMAVGGLACSDAGGQLTSSGALIDAEPTTPTVAGATTSPPDTGTPETTSTTSSASSTSAATVPPAADVTLPPLQPTGVDVPILLFGDSIVLVEPDGTTSLIQRDEAIRVAGDTTGGVVFQRELSVGPLSSILWQQDPTSVPVPIFIPAADQRAELHGITTVTGAPEAVFSVTSPNSDNRTLNRIGLRSGTITELALVDDAEFGSKTTQVAGLFIVTTWERPEGAGWTVYQSGTGREIGGSFPEDEVTCLAGTGSTCPRLATLSLDIETVFRIVPNHGDSHPGHYDLLLTRSENGQTITRVDLTTLDGEWYPEHLAELPDGRILLSRSVDPERLRPITAVVVDPGTGSITELSDAGFVRLT